MDLGKECKNRAAEESWPAEGKKEERD